jgi:hypothetical protein
MVEATPHHLSEATGSEHVESILFALQGSNHHDWYEGLCRELGLNRLQLFPILFVIWMRLEENAEAASETYGQLLSVVSGLSASDQKP